MFYSLSFLKLKELYPLLLLKILIFFGITLSKTKFVLMYRASVYMSKGEFFLSQNGNTNVSSLRCLLIIKGHTVLLKLMRQQILRITSFYHI